MLKPSLSAPSAAFLVNHTLFIAGAGRLNEGLHSLACLTNCKGISFGRLTGERFDPVTLQAENFFFCVVLVGSDNEHLRWYQYRRVKSKSFHRKWAAADEYLLLLKMGRHAQRCIRDVKKSILLN